jgi:hypothetical protein
VAGTASSGAGFFVPMAFAEIALSWLNLEMAPA